MGTSPRRVLIFSRASVSSAISRRRSSSSCLRAVISRMIPWWPIMVPSAWHLRLEVYRQVMTVPSLCLSLTS